MILETFTHKEIYTTLRKAYTILQDRSKSYLSNNYNKIFSLCKDNDYERVVQGTINNQRFSLGVCYKRIGKSVIYGANTLHTVFLCGYRKFVIKMYPYGPNVESVQYGIAYFTEHFLNRFCERLHLCPSDTPLLEKARLYDMNTDLKIHGSFDDNIISRFHEPSLNVPFLAKENRRISCECYKNGDIAIVEYYDKITVSRTYITKDMLFDSQLNDSSYIETVAKSLADQDKEGDRECIPEQFLKRN